MDKSQPAPASPPPAAAPPTPAVPSAAAAPKTPKPPSEAYLNRRKGRIVHPDALGYIGVMAPYLLAKGEITPRQMAKDLGLPKSTLIYNLNRLIRICQGNKKSWYGHIPAEYFVDNLLGGKRLERVSAGKYTRYRLVDGPTQGPGETPKA